MTELLLGAVASAVCVLSGWSACQIARNVVRTLRRDYRFTFSEEHEQARRIYAEGPGGRVIFVYLWGWDGLIKPLGVAVMLAAAVVAGYVAVTRLEEWWGS